MIDYFDCTKFSFKIWLLLDLSSFLLPFPYALLMIRNSHAPKSIFFDSGPTRQKKWSTSRQENIFKNHVAIIHHCTSPSPVTLSTFLLNSALLIFYLYKKSCLVDEKPPLLQSVVHATVFLATYDSQKSGKYLWWDPISLYQH